MNGVIEGRIVHYVLRKQDAEEINHLREQVYIKQVTIGYANGEDNSLIRVPTVVIPHGEQIHTGNPASAGDHCPMMIVRVWPNEFGPGQPGINGQVFLDGNDSYWVTSARFDAGGAPGTWHWVEQA